MAESDKIDGAGREPLPEECVPGVAGGLLEIAVYRGDIDFVLTVSAPDHQHLSEVIMRQIHGLPGVVSTRSHVVLDARTGTAPGTRLDDWHVSDSSA